MQHIDRIYIGGAFVEPHGEEMFDLFNPATERVIGRVRLADEHDANRAVAAAKRAFASFSRTRQNERLDLLQSMANALEAREDDLYEAIIDEYGSPVSARAGWRNMRQPRSSRPRRPFANMTSRGASTPATS